MMFTRKPKPAKPRHRKADQNAERVAQMVYRSLRDATKLVEANEHAMAFAIVQSVFPLAVWLGSRRIRSSNPNPVTLHTSNTITALAADGLISARTTHSLQCADQAFVMGSERLRDAQDHIEASVGLIQDYQGHFAIDVVHATIAYGLVVD